MITSPEYTLATSLTAVNSHNFHKTHASKPVSFTRSPFPTQYVSPVPQDLIN